MSEKRGLRRIFRPKIDKVKWEWRKLLFQEIHGLYSPIIIRVIKLRYIICAVYVARIGKRRDAYRVMVRKPEGKRPLGRPRRRWEDNTKMDLQEFGWGHGVIWTGSGWRQCGNEP